MPITPRNISAHEWTGLRVSIVDCADPTIRRLSGLVLDETKNTFAIENKGRTIRVPKADTVFAATLPSGETLTIAGNLMIYRPEDRVKKGLSKW